jgi:hypothetical protein
MRNANGGAGSAAGTSSLHTSQSRTQANASSRSFDAPATIDANA